MLDVLAEGCGEFGELGFVRLGQVVFFVRIVFEVVELHGLEGRVVDKLPLAAAHGVNGFAHIAEVAFAAAPEEISRGFGL